MRLIATDQNKVSPTQNLTPFAKNRKKINSSRTVAWDQRMTRSEGKKLDE